MKLQDGEAALAAMLDDLDLPGSWTQRQRNDYADRRAYLRNLVNVTRQTMSVLAEVDPKSNA